MEVAFHLHQRCFTGPRWWMGEAPSTLHCVGLRASTQPASAPVRLQFVGAASAAKGPQPAQGFARADIPSRMNSLPQGSGLQAVGWRRAQRGNDVPTLLRWASCLNPTYIRARTAPIRGSGFSRERPATGTRFRAAGHSIANEFAPKGRSGLQAEGWRRAQRGPTAGSALLRWASCLNPTCIRASTAPSCGSGFSRERPAASTRLRAAGHSIANEFAPTGTAPSPGGNARCLALSGG